MISSPVVQETPWAVSSGATFFSKDFNLEPRPKKRQILKLDAFLGVAAN